MGRLYPTPSDEAVDIWRAFASAHGVSYTAIIEALADELARLERTPEGRLPILWREVLAKARAHDAAGRDRSR